MAHRHCSSYARSKTPAPAGTGLSRRSFLMRSAGLALSVYGGSRLLDLDALQAGVAQAAGPSNATIVSVFLDGGIDNLSVLAPVGDPLYRKLRPRLALREDGLTRFDGDDRLAWHPAAAGLAKLHKEGKVAVMPAVGYDDPDQSHFTSRHFWEVGALNPNERTGWLGRWLDRVGSNDNPLQGLSLDGRLAPTLATSRVPVASVSGPEEYSFWARNVWGPIEERMLETIGSLGAAHAGSPDPALAQAGDAAAQSARLRTQLSPFTQEGGSIVAPVAYPDGDDDFPRHLKDLAGLLAAGLPIRAVALSAAGEYDTHDNQRRGLRVGPEAHGRLAARVPARPRGARPRRPRGRPRLVGVRPPCRGERLARHRSRRRRRRLPDRLAREGRHDRRVPRAQPARRAGEPARDLRLPRDPVGAARAVAGRGRRGDHPRRRPLRSARRSFADRCQTTPSAVA